ncbi:hypothetical protein BGZ63DRAFT_362455 [Mariannaea sp. PMI_226]|nr:hypothetical protein BGZ63DRAFT_362455 [Mariannaea sp. PMI_226]
MWNWTGPDSNSPPPPGVVPNFDNPVDVAWTRNVAIMIVCDALVTIFFIIRVYVKIHISHRILAEDCEQEYYHLLEWLYINTVVYCPAAYFTKVTILLLMARVFAVEEKLSKAIYFFIWALLIAYTPIQLIKMFVCIPIPSLWDPRVRHVRCVDQRRVFFGDSAVAILTDTIILLVPIVPIWRLHMPLRKKIKIVALLSAGGVATGITIYRTYKIALFVHSDNLTVDYVDIDILACIELTIGFVCACLPSLNIIIEKCCSGRRSQRDQQSASSWPRRKGFLQRNRTTGATPFNAPSDLPRSTADESPTTVANFDTELAMLGSEPGEPAPRKPEGQVIRPVSAKCRRISSSEGRSEGWLSLSKLASEHHQNSEYVMRAVERSRLVREQGPEAHWCPVWDGPRDEQEPTARRTECSPAPASSNRLDSILN